MDRVSFKFLACIRDGETSIDGDCSMLRWCSQPANVTLERHFVGDAAIEALVLKDTQLDLGHVQPTAMLWCVMQLQLPGDPPRLSRLERFIERRDLTTSQPSRPSWVHPFASACLAGRCCSPDKTPCLAESQGLTGYLVCPEGLPVPVKPSSIPSYSFHSTHLWGTTSRFLGIQCHKDAYKR
jgi:hypothetical protein